MKQFFLTALLAAGLLAGPARAQVATYWFEVANGTLLLKSAAGSKPVATAVALPNGTQLDYRSNLAQLADGSRVTLHDGDAVSLSGIITYAPKAAPPPAAAPAGPVVPVASAGATALAGQPAFAYTAPAPVRGQLKGVVELGASGFNSFVARVDAQRNWKLEKSEFGHSLVLENLTTDVEVRQVLKAYIGKMLDYGVGGRDIYFIVSSGAMQSANTPRIVQSLRELGYVVTPVTAEREGVLALRTVLPASYANKAFVVDMGSANTKISWLAGGKPTSQETYGAKYYEQHLPDEAVAAAVRAKAALVPPALRQTCFIIGGAPFEMARRSRQGTERYTALAAPTSYPTETAKAKAGTNIYQAVAEATGCQQFVFDWDSNFTIGYLLAQP